MKKFQRLQIALSAVLLCAGANNAFAGNAGTFYLGIGVGSSTYDFSSSDCNNQLRTQGVPGSVNCTTTPTDSAAKLLAGYNVTPNAAVEFSSVSLGNLVFNFTGPGGQITVTDQVDVLSLDLVGTSTPNSSQFFFEGRIGAYNATSSVSDPKGITNASGTNSGMDIGLGLGYEFTKHSRARLEFQHFRGIGTSETVVSNPDMVTAVYVYNF